MLDVRQAEQLVFTAAETIPDLERRIEQQENFISTLLGESPAGYVRRMRLISQLYSAHDGPGLFPEVCL